MPTLALNKALYVHPWAQEYRYEAIISLCPENKTAQSYRLAPPRVPIGPSAFETKDISLEGQKRAGKEGQRVLLNSSKESSALDSLLH